MTEIRRSQGVHILCTTCALILCLWSATAVLGGPAWDMFQARCLDPYEHQTEPVVEGLDRQPVDQMHEAQLVYAGRDGLLLVLDAAPSDGNRSCSVVTPSVDGMDDGYLDWVRDVTQRQIYVPEGDMLASAEWIEPQVHVAATLDAVGATYRVLETDLES